MGQSPVRTTFKNKNKNLAMVKVGDILCSRKDIKEGDTIMIPKGSVALCVAAPWKRDGAYYFVFHKGLIGIGNRQYIRQHFLNKQVAHLPRFADYRYEGEEKTNREFHEGYFDLVWKLSGRLPFLKTKHKI